MLGGPWAPPISLASSSLFDGGVGHHGVDARQGRGRLWIGQVVHVVTDHLAQWPTVDRFECSQRIVVPLGRVPSREDLLRSPALPGIPWCWPSSGPTQVFFWE